ncbi:MAG: redoxin domain-containing protein [Ardenticatenaceae bacterium]|nr:redoxin domain-containing protein [Ardenticatenaceae bacterium]
MAVALGQPLPDFELPSLQEPERRFRLIDERGKIVVVLFWAATCPMVRRYNRYLEGFADSYRSQGVRPLAVDSHLWDTPERLRFTLGRRLPRFPILIDRDGAVARQFGVEVTPTVYVADRDGVLRYWGAIDDMSLEKHWPDVNYLEKAVDALLLEQEVADPSDPPVGCELELAVPA